MTDQTGRTVICSVAFLDIVEYSKRSVTEQITLKDEFNRLIAEAIKDIAPNDRILVDSGDGAALCFLGDPEDALFVAINLRDQIRKTGGEQGLTVRFGINLGPVRLVKDINDRPNILGDGINDAQRVMSFAKPNQILVSRSYFEVVSRLSQEYTNLFHYRGAHTDKHVREHEVYEVEVPVEAGPDDTHVGVKTEVNIPQFKEVASHAAAEAIAPANRKPLVFAGIGLAVLLVGALSLTLGGKKETAGESKPAPAEAKPAAATQTTTPTETPARDKSPAAKIEPPVKKPAAESKPAAPADKAASMAAAKPKAGMGTLELWVSPWGDVYVNGKMVGTSPPLRRLPLPAGKHQVEIRSQEGFPYHGSHEIKAGQTTRITKSFP